MPLHKIIKGRLPLSLAAASLLAGSSVAQTVQSRGGVIVAKASGATVYFPQYVKDGDIITWACESPEPLTVSLNGTPFTVTLRAQTFKYRVSSGGAMVQIGRGRQNPLQIPFSFEKPAPTVPPPVEFSPLSLGAAVRVLGEFQPAEVENLKATMNSEPTKPLVVVSSSYVVLMQFPGSFGQVTARIGKTFVSTRALGVSVQHATKSINISIDGLKSLAAPVELGIWNRDYEAYTLEGGVSQAIRINPSAVTPQGTFNVTRGVVPIAGTTPRGPVQIGFYLGEHEPSEAIYAREANAARQLKQAESTASQTLLSWQANTGIKMEDQAQNRILREFSNAIPLLAAVRANGQTGADNTNVQRQLLRHYCFDLRDSFITRLHAAGNSGTLSGFPKFAFQSSNSGSGPTITSGTVERFSFTKFLKDFLNGKSNVVVGNLELKSVPDHATVFIDASTPTGFTNRNFVCSVGKRNVRIATTTGRQCNLIIEVTEGATSQGQCQ